MAEKDASLNTAKDTVQKLKNDTDPQLQTLSAYKESFNEEDPDTFVGFKTKIDDATRIVGEIKQAAETTTTTLRT